MTSRVKIYFDGGCRPNPGTMEIAVVRRGLAHVSRDSGYGTAMDAEWLALIAALRCAQSWGDEHFVLIGDAAAVINQATGRAQLRGRNAGHEASFRAQIGTDPFPQIRYIKRAQNLAGIVLARGHAR